MEELASGTPELLTERVSEAIENAEPAEQPLIGAQQQQPETLTAEASANGEQRAAEEEQEPVRLSA